MRFYFGAHSALLLPFVVPGAVATLWLLGRAAQKTEPLRQLRRQL